MDGLECKRCKAEMTFQVLCDDCESAVFKRTDKLVKRGYEAKKAADKICDELGADALQVLTKLDDEVTDVELYQAFRRSSLNEPQTNKQFNLCIRLLKLEDERIGYGELAEMSCKIPFDDSYLRDEIAAATNYQWLQQWKDQ
jgi:hypothetical protein